MTAARGADILACDVGRQAAGNERKILLQGHFDPAVFADRVRGYASSNGSIGRASESKASPVISRNSS